MTHGGKRPGAGRKAERGPLKRVLVKLDEGELALLERLMDERDESASDVLRVGLELLAGSHGLWKWHK